jgi:catechol 2,3-dioxygenase-like lactoylglutathione lyase family enzyme
MEANMTVPKPKSAITFLKTKDLEETTQFYTRIMGFEFVLDQSGCRIFQITPNSYIGFCLTEDSTGSDEVIFTLEIEDVDGACAYLESLGIEIAVKPRLNERYKIYQMFIQDPNGYSIELQRFLDPAWCSNPVE